MVQQGRSTLSIGVRHLRLRTLLVVAAILILASLALAPQAAALACEPTGGSCYCPGC